MTSQVLLLTSLSILWRAWNQSQQCPVSHRRQELHREGFAFVFTGHGSYNVIHQVFDCSYSQHQEQGHQSCVPWQGTYFRNRLQKTNKIRSVQDHQSNRNQRYFTVTWLEKRKQHIRQNFKSGWKNEQKKSLAVMLLGNQLPFNNCTGSYSLVELLIYGMNSRNIFSSWNSWALQRVHSNSVQLAHPRSLP